MIGLDTNVLVRYLAQDDPVQSHQASTFIEQHLTPSNPGYVSLVVMVETVWVLERSYRLTPDRIANTVERMLQSESLVVEAEQAVFTAMIALRQGQGAFADALIAELGRAAGCTHTVTFDREALRLAGFAALES